MFENFGRKLQTRPDSPPKNKLDHPPLGIKTITYARLLNTGNFENQKIEVTCELEPGQDPDEQFIRLKTWADEKLLGTSQPAKKKKRQDHWGQNLSNRRKQSQRAF